MYRNVTAIYRTHATAALVREELATLGISSGSIHVIPDRDEGLGVAGPREDRDANEELMVELSDLELPDEDARTYQQAVRDGDTVVSVEVDNDADIERVRQIMRRPEDSHDLAGREAGFRDAELQDQGAAVDAMDAGRRGRRDASLDDPYLRGYERDSPLVPRPMPMADTEPR